MFLNPVETMCVRCHRISKCHNTYVCQLEHERVRLPFQPFSKNGRLHEATVGYTQYSLHDQSFIDLFPPLYYTQKTTAMHTESSVIYFRSTDSNYLGRNKRLAKEWRVAKYKLGNQMRVFFSMSNT